MRKCKRMLHSLWVIIMLICLLTPLAAYAAVHLPITEEGMFFGFDDIETFNSYLQSSESASELPANFIRPQDFSPIGSFNTWGSSDYTLQTPYITQYYYAFNLWEEGSTVWFHILHNEYLNYGSYPTLDISYANGDMRTLKSTPDSSLCYIIRRGSLYFFYDASELSSIIWYRISQQDDGYGKYTVVDTFRLDPYGKLLGSEFVCSPNSFMDKLLSLDEEKFREAEDVLISLGTGKYSDYEYTPPATEPTVPTEPTIPPEPTEPATPPQTQLSPTTAATPTTLTEPTSTMFVPLLITATLSLAAGSVATYLILQRKKRK